MENELEFVKEFITKNAEDNDVKGFISTLAPKPEEIIPSFMETDEGKKFFQPMFDKRTTKAIETWKENHVPGIKTEIENKLRQELNPAETADQKRIRELELKQKESDMKVLKQERENFTIKLANSYGLENVQDNLDMFIHDSEEKITNRMDWLKERDKLMFEKGRSSILKESSHIPQSGDESDKLNWNSLEEYGRYVEKFPHKYDEAVYTKLANRSK